MHKLCNFLCIFFAYRLLLVYGIKSLKDNPGFDSIDAWESGYLPCSLEQVVFPETYAALLPLPSQVDISGFILPHDGAILLNQDMTIDLSGQAINNGRSCENGREGRAYLKPPQIRKWYDPQSWNLVRTKSNKERDDLTYTTHLQRVPCDNEPVIIKPKGPIGIDLEYATYMRMGQLSLAGSLVTKKYMQYLLSMDLGELMFHNSDDVMVEYYRDGVCGCHRDFTNFIEPVCHNVISYCAKPHCLEPILPYGSCCAICGAVMRLAVTRCDDVKLQAVKKLLLNSRIVQELEKDLDLDISYFDSKEYGKFLQIIVIDRLEYKERSVGFLQQFNATNKWTKILEGGQRLEISYSGRPYNPNVSFFSMLIIVLCFIFVLFVALVIFAHYEPHHHMLQHIPIWIYDTRHWRNLLTRTQHAFVRFENIGRRNTLSDVQETTVGGNAAENIAIGYNAESGRLRERSFDNPMFNKKPIEKNKTEAEQQKQPTLETGSLTSTQNQTHEHEGDDIQELKEIKLDSTSDENDSDIEAETKE